MELRSASSVVVVSSLVKPGGQLAAWCLFSHSLVCLNRLAQAVHSLYLPT